MNECPQNTSRAMYNQTTPSASSAPSATANSVPDSGYHHISVPQQSTIAIDDDEGPLSAVLRNTVNVDTSNPSTSSHLSFMVNAGEDPIFSQSDDTWQTPEATAWNAWYQEPRSAANYADAWNQYHAQGTTGGQMADGGGGTTEGQMADGGGGVTEGPTAAGVPPEPAAQLRQMQSAFMQSAHSQSQSSSRCQQPNLVSDSSVSAPPSTSRNLDTYSMIAAMHASISPPPFRIIWRVRHPQIQL